MVTMGKLPQTPRAKKVIEYAIEEARNLNHNYVGTEHLLLGLLREHDGVAAQVLMNLGLKLEEVREEVLNLLGAGVESEEPQDKEKSGGGGGAAKGKSKTPALDSFGRDLTELAKEGTLDPVIGRKNEIERVIQILCRRQKNNPVLLGEAGVGKTAIVEGLAQMVIGGNVPDLLHDRRIVVLDLAMMVAGTKYRGQFEERIKAVMNEGPPGQERDPVHRRAAHAGRGRRCGGGHRREQRTQAGPLPRRDPVHRSDDLRRVPQVHREGQRAGPPVPAGAGRPAEQEGRGRDPQGVAGSVREPPPGPDHGRRHRRGGRSCRTGTSPGGACRTRRSTCWTRRGPASGCGA